MTDISTVGSKISVMRASQFVDGIGVNTHISWTDTAWGNWANIEKELAYTGITNVRDSIPYQNWTLPEYQKIASEGIKFDIIISGPTIDIATDLSAIDRLEASNPGSVVTVEGANEFNTNNYTYAGSSSYNNPAWGAQVDSALAQAIKADPALAGVAVVASSMANANRADVAAQGNLEDTVDASNAHIYFGQGSEPGANISAGIAQARATAPNAPVIITETGYYTAVDAMDWGGGGVSEAVQAKLTLNLLLDAAKDGAAKTFLYELMDNTASSSSDLENSLGLFHADGTPKLAATALHNLTSILADTGTNATTFTTGSFAPVLAGMPSTGNTLVMQKSNGVFDLVLWAEPTLWNEATRSAVVAPTQSVSVDLGATYATVSIYDPLLGTGATQVLSNVRSLTIAVNDHPIIIEVGAPVVAPTVLLASQVLQHDTGTSATDNITSDGAVMLTGAVTGAAGTKVEILDGKTDLGAATLGSGGAWSYATTLTSGAHALRAVATDLAGNSTTSATAASILIETMVPTVTIASEALSSDRRSEIMAGTYTGAAGTSVKIFNGATALGNATLDGKGGWTYSAALSPGSYSLLAVATDLAGNRASVDPSFTIPTVAPVTAPAPTPPKLDTLVLQLSEDAYQGDAQFTVTVDGKQVGGTQTITALHAKGQTQSLTLTGDYGVGLHTVGINFLNDLYGGASSKDRNLYVGSLTLDGLTTVKNAAQATSGLVNYAVRSPTATAAATAASAPLSLLSLTLSEDAYQGDAQFTINVDGQQVGGAQVVKAAHGSGQTQVFNIAGNYGAGTHVVGVNFINDAWAGAGKDRNLYVDAMSLGGTTLNTHATQATNGLINYAIQGVATLSASANTTLTVATGATLLLGTQTSAETNVSFSGNAGTLQLTGTPAFSGTIAGFSHGDTIDFRSIGFGASTHSTFTGQNGKDVFSLTDGSHSVLLAMQGSYVASQFHLASDGQGGTAISLTR